MSQVSAPIASPVASKLFRFDEALRAYHKGRVLVGVDEVGRGPLAGPVVAAAVILPEHYIPELEKVRDSKALSPRRRQVLFDAIRSSATQVGVGWAMAEEIDRHNILQATFLAMRRALGRLKLSPESALVVVDGNQRIPGITHEQKPLVKGDAYSLMVAAASIVAKVVRDRWMEQLDRRFPGYSLALHKGYGTSEHIAALNRLGPSPIHRRSFAPVAQAALPFLPYEKPDV